MELTAKTIDTVSLPEGKSELVAFDEKIAGCGIRIRAGGNRTFFCQYRTSRYVSQNLVGHKHIHISSSTVLRARRKIRRKGGGAA
jgi:hypothetical protein